VKLTFLSFVNYYYCYCRSEENEFAWHYLKRNSVPKTSSNHNNKGDRRAKKLHRQVESNRIMGIEKVDGEFNLFSSCSLAMNCKNCKQTIRCAIKFCLHSFSLSLVLLFKHTQAHLPHNSSSLTRKKNVLKFFDYEMRDFLVY
jgi:hypothetical protein